VTKGTPNDPLLITNTPGTRYARRLSIPALSIQHHRLILIGSLFGSGRISVDASPSAPKRLKDIATQLKIMKSRIGRAMAFRNPLLMRPANQIVERLGGKEGFIGVHARIGDGEFERSKERNMERVWWRIMARLELEEGVAEAMWEQVKPKSHVDKRFNISETEFDLDDVDTNDGEDDDNNDDVNEGLLKRAPFIRPIVNLKSLTCRSPLYTSPALELFNTPLYLATDARSPETDPTLAIFFRSFPCTFILSDFEPSSASSIVSILAEEEINQGIVIESIGMMKSAINENDGVPLGRLFLPFLEAMVAAKGIMTVGTSGSTFSGSLLHFSA
jgi:hypothetical protein